jgi:hypothetical protein
MVTARNAEMIRERRWSPAHGDHILYEYEYSNWVAAIAASPLRGDPACRMSTVPNGDTIEGR